MNINVKWNEMYADVTVEDGSTKIDLGLLDQKERLDLILELANAIALLSECTS